MLDRARLDPKRIQAIANSVREVVASDGSDRGGVEGVVASQRSEDLEETSADRSHWDYLRISAKRDQRRGLPLSQGWQCRDFAGRVRGHPIEHGSRGGSQQGCKDVGLPEYSVQLVPSTDRAAVTLMAQLDRYIHLIIPRGGRSLIEAVTSAARMPVIKHFDGICAAYVDRAADLRMAERIVVNAKCQRPGVCNAIETMLVHEEVARQFLPACADALWERGVELRGDLLTQEILGSKVVPATEEDWRTEYLDLILAIKTVRSLEEAVDHIETYGSHHSDAIITEDPLVAQKFLNQVDSAAVFWNASTRFNDGGEFGFGAEIGISTDRLHARGPMGLEELTSYKYLVEGTGQIRR